MQMQCFSRSLETDNKSRASLSFYLFNIYTRIREQPAPHNTHKHNFTAFVFYVDSFRVTCVKSAKFDFDLLLLSLLCFVTLCDIRDDPLKIESSSNYNLSTDCLASLDRNTQTNQLYCFLVMFVVVAVCCYFSFNSAHFVFFATYLV